MTYKNYGEDHHLARLTAREVRTIRRMREDDPKHWTYRRLAEAFDCSTEHVAKLCRLQRRWHDIEGTY